METRLFSKIFASTIWRNHLYAIEHFNKISKTLGLKYGNWLLNGKDIDAAIDIELMTVLSDLLREGDK